MAAASLLGAALPVATAWLALGRELGAGAAGRALVSPWVYLANSEVRDLAFYRQGIGLDRPLANVASAGLWATGIVAALAIGVVLARRRWAGRGLAGPVFLVLPGTLLFLLRDHLHWTSFARPLPYVLAVAIAIQLRALARARAAGEPAEPRAIARLAATAYALLLLLKMALNTRLHQYGFALALPGSLLVVAWLVGVAPERWCAPPGRRRLRQWVVSLVLGVLAVQVGISARVWRGQGTKLDLGADSLVADAQASFHRLIAERLRTRMPARATLVVVPEGVMVNYLNRRVNPTPFVNFMPPELLLFGEERILAALRRAPPDFVLLTNRDAADYGMGMLGRDHGRDLMRWIEGSYETVDEIREPSSAGLYFSYGLLLRRRGLGP
jgi:hypothetical protein